MVSALPDGAMICAVTSPRATVRRCGRMTLACSAASADLRLLGRIVQSHRFAFGHVALICHPAYHLPPKTIVIFVFHPFSPPPGAVGAHEEHLAGAEVRVASSGNRPNSFDDILMHAQHFGAGLGATHRGVPLKAGQILPDFDVVLLRVGQLRQQAAAAEFGQLEAAGRARSPSARLGTDRARRGRGRSVPYQSSDNCRPCQPGMKTRPLA